jgi:competence ComEA-like helix-hairpin-helix protein
MASATTKPKPRTAAVPPPTAAAIPAWISLLTVHSGVHNVSASGQARINIQTADEAALTSIRGITTEIAKAIIAHRSQNQFESIADLLDVGPAPREGQPGTPSPGTDGPPAPGPGPGSNVRPSRGGTPGGPKLISQELLIEIADQLTADEASLQPGVVNVNTASLEVLACLPGITRELAQAIISHRSSSGFLDNIAQLLRVPGITPDLFEGLARRVTTRSETYRILAEGRIRSSGVRQRIQSIVRIGVDDVETLAYREDDL